MAQKLLIILVVCNKISITFLNLYLLADICFFLVMRDGNIENWYSVFHLPLLYV